MESLAKVADDSFALVLATWTVADARSFLQGLEYTHVIILRPGAQSQYYLYTKEQSDTVLQRASAKKPLEKAFDLQATKPTPVRDGRTAVSDAPDQTVVLEQNEVLGFIDLSGPHFHISNKSVRPRAGLGHIPELYRPRSIHTRGETRKDFAPSRRLEAYPGLEAPESATCGSQISVFAELRSRPDVLIVQSGKMIFQNLEPDEKCLVVLVADGAKVTPEHATLPIQYGAKVEFRCAVEAKKGAVRLTAQFFFRHQLLGVAQRMVHVSPTHDTGAPVRRARWPLKLHDSSNAIDITLTIDCSQDGKAHWSWAIPALSIQTADPVIKQLPRTRDFAAGLIRDLKAVDWGGSFAANILETYGQEVADQMPKRFFDDLRSLYAVLNRPPALLLVTNENFVPWELALLPEPLVGKKVAPPYLAAQTWMSRWVMSDEVMHPPPSVVEIRKMTAVAGDLEAALNERQKLHDRWRFFPLDAQVAKLVPLVRGARARGHLVHFAIHGFSDPLADNQVLLLKDNQTLPASALTGGYQPGTVPRFAFVFLNACQVGTAGSSLGQAAGFPGVLLRAGVLGFVAPFWNVHDDLARDLALRFYDAAFEKNLPLAEILQAERARYKEKQSTTPLAYVYYGHPSLRLEYARPAP